jgi:hypothetical protein
MTIVYVQLPREDVIPYLGPNWPPEAGVTVLRCPNPAGVTDGAVVVYTTPGRPGTTWWLVDSVIPPQDAGPVDEALAALIPESVLEVLDSEPVEEPAPPTEPQHPQTAPTDIV